jgi:hypothetical protein
VVTFRPNAIYIHTRLAHLAKLTIIAHVDKTGTLEYDLVMRPNNCELCEHCAFYNGVVTPCRKFPKSLMHVVITNHRIFLVFQKAQRRVFHFSDLTFTFRNTKAVNYPAICWAESRRRPMPNRDRHRTRPGRLGGRTDGQPSRPVLGSNLARAHRPVDGRQGGRPSRPSEDGWTDGCWVK